MANIKKMLMCFICGNEVGKKESDLITYDGYDRTICHKCQHEHPEIFDDLNNATNTVVVSEEFVSTVAEAANLMHSAQLQVGSESMQIKMRDMVEKLTNLAPKQ